MNVILLEKVRNLGVLGDTVNVKPGFARNFLVPQGKAVFATLANIAAFDAKRAEFEKAEQEKLDQANARAQQLAELKLAITAKAGDEGKLFGSLGTADLAELMTDAGVAVEKHEVRLPEGPIRHIGEYTVAVQLHSDVSVGVAVNVVAE